MRRNHDQLVQSRVNPFSRPEGREIVTYLRVGSISSVLFIKVSNRSVDIKNCIVRLRKECIRGIPSLNDQTSPVRFMSRNKRKTLHKHRSANALQKSRNESMKPNGDRRTLLRKTDRSERIRNWTARSSDLTPTLVYATLNLRFILQTVKAVVYSTRVDSRQELIGRINGAPTELKQDKHEIRRMINSNCLRCQPLVLYKIFYIFILRCDYITFFCYFCSQDTQ